MILTIAVVLGSFALLIRRSYRRGAHGYRPQGQRWTDETAP